MPRVNFFTGPIQPLSPETVREAISGQTCPWCGRGPFRVLAGHVQSAHGINRQQLREMAILYATDSICSSESSARRQIISRQLFEEGRSGIRTYQKGTKKNLNTACRLLQKAKIDAVPPEIRSRNSALGSRSVSPENRRVGRMKTSIKQKGVRRVPQVHGTLTESGAHRCRCNLCTQARSEYNRNWRSLRLSYYGA
jgi:hypothetical protein